MPCWLEIDGVRHVHCWQSEFVVVYAEGGRVFSLEEALLMAENDSNASLPVYKAYKVYHINPVWDGSHALGDLLETFSTEHEAIALAAIQTENQ